MRSSALFAILLGTSISFADPPKPATPKQEKQTKQQEEDNGRVSLNDENAKKPDPVRQAGEWVELASPTPAMHGTEIVIVGSDAGSFSKLRFMSTTGKTIVRDVRVYFDDGSTKKVQVDKILPEGKYTVVDLKGDKRIDRIRVNTETHTKGQYTIYGSSEGAVVGAR